MKNDNDLTKFIYATAYTGQVVKIPLRDYVDQGYIMQKLINEGVDINGMNHLFFSTVEPESKFILRSNFPNRAQIEAGLVDPFPPFPVPQQARTWPAQWSTIMARKYTPLIKLKESNSPFCMIRSDGVSVNLWSYPQEEFKTKSEWEEIENGEVGLLYAVAWKQKNVHTLIEGMTYEQRLLFTHGMSTTTQYSISATLGASGFGLSASISATFGQSFLIEESQAFTESIKVEGIQGKTLNICMWQLVDLFFLVKKDKAGNYNFIKEYNITIEKPNKYTLKYHADPLFFGNTEKTNDGKDIVTNLVHATDNIQMNVTGFINS